MNKHKNTAGAKPKQSAKTIKATDKNNKNSKQSTAPVLSSGKSGIENRGSGKAPMDNRNAGMSMPKVGISKYRVIANRAGGQLSVEAEDAIAMLYDMQFDCPVDAEEVAVVEMELMHEDFLVVQVDPRTSQMCARTEEQIDDEIQHLADIIWYNRCYQLDDIYKAEGRPVPKDLRAVCEIVEFRCSDKELNRWTGDEGSVIYGRLSALQWIKGYEMNSLDKERTSAI